jgi:hypothetical protein
MTERFKPNARAAVGIIVLAMVLALSPSQLFAQGVSGSITGVVRDTSGAVLPGVTAQVSSPALIEKTREAVTDAEGRYRITDLRPGTYAAVFTLTGFQTVRREGIELTANFIATVNADLRVGSFEETLTVSGQTPLVDVQSVVQQTTVSREVLDAVPIGKTFINISSLTPAVIIGGQAVQDMGNGGDRSGTMQAHGSRLSESQIDVDGMPIHNGLARGGGQFGHYVNDGSTQEMIVEVGGMNAEHEIAGIRANVIPKEGGNTIRGSVNTSYSGSRLQSNNLDANLISRGLTSINHNNKVWDFSPNAGGSLIRDRLWFYTAFRHWGLDNRVAGLYENATPQSFFYTPDLTKPGRDLSWHVSANMRLTIQASQRNKFNVFGEHQYSCFCYGYNPSSSISPEAQGFNRHRPQYLLQSTWSHPHTNRLLFDAGFTLMANDPHRYPQPGVGPDQTGIVDTSKNFTYRSMPGGYGFQRSDNYNGRASASYVTGSHSFKTGLFWMYEWNYVTTDVLSSMSFTFNGTTPTGLTEWADPLIFRERARNIGLYAQDQWTVGRMTLNYGGRYDRIHGWVPAAQLPAGPFVGARSYAKVDNVPLYNDLSPRLGFSYDVFGKGKTAVKASLGRYLLGIGSNSPIGAKADPVTGAVNSVTRSWTDSNNNYLPDCDLRNPLAQDLSASGGDKCGQMSNLNFGNPNTATTVFDPSAVTGWGHRGYNWETNLGVQHELKSGVSASVNYVRRWYGNFFVTYNTALTAADYDPFCVTAPPNANLPGGGGNTVCGFYDAKPGKFGQNTSVIKLDDGKMKDVYSGVDLTLNVRLPSNVMVTGGTSTGREPTDVCAFLNQPNVSPGLLANGAANVTSGFVGSAATVLSPNTQAFCHINPPFQTNVKFSAVYPLPWFGLQTSATFQSLPGVALSPSYQATATNTGVSQTLGRAFSEGSTLLVDLAPPNTLFSRRINQTNIRLEKAFRLTRGKFRAMVDLFNLFNQNPVLAFNTRVNATYPLPTLIEPARMVKFGAQWDF